MILPIPLCAFHGTSFYDIAAAIVGWTDTRELPTEYVEEGVRIGDQTGRWGARIAEESVMPWRFPKGTMSNTLTLNGPRPKGAVMPTRPESGGRNVPCAVAWYDGQYYWAAMCYVSFVVGYDSYRAVYKLQNGVDAYGWGVLVADAFNMNAETLRQYTLTYGSSTASYYYRQNVRVNLLNKQAPREFTWITDERESRVSYEEMYDPEEVYQIALSGARYVCREGNWNGYADWGSLQTLYRPLSDDPNPSLKAIPTLLNTFEFSDPQLASGVVAPVAGWHERQCQPTVWDRLKRRDVSENTDMVFVPKGGPYGSYMFEWLVQHAWMDAANSIPQANQNSVQNVMAAFELLSSLRTGNVAEIPDILWDEWKAWTTSAKAYAKGAANMWLRWRYEVSTTKQDIDEYVKFGLDVIDRYMQQITSSRTHGSATYETETGVYKCTCSMTWTEKGLTGLSHFFHSLWKTGLEPNAYVLWDFVPFSFVADWFGQFGDVLETYSSKQYRNTAYYDFSDIVFSIRYRTGPIAGMYADHYVRWVAEQPPAVDEAYWYDTGGASTSATTVFKRVLDSGSLLTGMSIK